MSSRRQRQLPLFEPREPGPDELPGILRRNIWTGVLGNVSVSYMTAGVFFAAYCKLQGMQPYQFGVLRALVAASSLLMLFSPGLEERFGRRKLPWFLLVLASRLVLLPLALGLALGISPAVIVLIVVVHACGAKAGSPLFLSWSWNYVPGHQAARFWARRTFWIKLARMAFGLAAGLAARQIAPPDQRTFLTAVFVFLLALGIADIVLHVRIPEPPRRAGPSGSLSKVADALKNAPFRNWLLVSALWSFAAGISGPFGVPYLYYKLGFEGKYLQVVLLSVVIPSVFSLAVLPMWGRLLDTRRPMVLIVICSAFWPLIPLLFFLAPVGRPAAAFWFLAGAWAVAGVFPAAVAVARQAMTAQLCGVDKTMPAAVYWVGLAVGQSIGAWVGALVVREYDMRGVFFVSSAARAVVAFAMYLLLVYRPTRAPNGGGP